MRGIVNLRQSATNFGNYPARKQPNQHACKFIVAHSRKTTAWARAFAGQVDNTAWRAEPRTTRGGQPHYSALAITTALVLRAVFRLALRQTEGLIGSVLRLLGLDLAVPDHSTLSRRAETLAVPRPRSDPGPEPMPLLVDSTGLRLCGPGEWLAEQHSASKRWSWRKLQVAMPGPAGSPRRR
jgi:hypothetical protein